MRTFVKICQKVQVSTTILQKKKFLFLTWTSKEVIKKTVYEWYDKEIPSIHETAKYFYIPGFRERGIEKRIGKDNGDLDIVLDTIYPSKATSIRTMFNGMELEEFDVNEEKLVEVGFEKYTNEIEEFFEKHKQILAVSSTSSTMALPAYVKKKPYIHLC